MISNAFPFAAIILAAGASSRMGRPKMLLPWRESTVLGHLIAQWKSVGATQIAVVCADADEAIASELDRLGFPREQRIINADPARGMFSSIQCAASWPKWDVSLKHWAIVLGDQPHLATATLRAVAEFAAQNVNYVCQPAHNQRPRHPVFLPKWALAQLANSNHQTLKDFLKANAAEVRLTKANDPGLEIDLDRPADYERAAALSTASPRSAN